MVFPFIAWVDSLPQKPFETALHRSMCVFGGRDMNELHVTSARKGISRSDLKKYPLSGGLFKVVTNVTGMKTFQFG
jgi:sugar lactone lactonase YvrE